MARKGSREYAPDADYMLGAHQWARQLERDTGLIVQLGMHPRAQDGVWGIVLRVRHRIDTGAGGVVCQVKGSWPNSVSQSLGAYLMQLTADLDRLAAEDAEAILKRS